MPLLKVIECRPHYSPTDSDLSLSFFAVPRSFYHSRKKRKVVITSSFGCRPPLIRALQAIGSDRAARRTARSTGAVMTPRVLYCCPCTLAVGPKSDQAVSSSSSNKLDHRSDPQAPSITPRNKTNNSRNILDTIPPLPCYDAPSQYSYFSLDELYFCEECDQIKCKRCTTAEVSAYYCPACLYDVQAANVKADRMRCMRSCYVCPICETTMQVVASDPKQSVNLLSAAANQGEAPFFLLCSCCKWDSKEIGWTFDKQTGISSKCPSS